MKDVIAKIESALASARSPVVLWSGGKDATLLLYLCRLVNPETPAIWFRTGQHEAFAKRMMAEWDLTVLTYAPMQKYALSDGNNLSILHEFAWGRSVFPVAADVKEGTQCSLKEYQRTPSIFHSFDVALCGWKATDRHWLLGDSPFPPEDGAPLDNTRFYAPLRDWTDEQVWQATRELGLPYDETIYGEGETDEVALCTRCYTGCGESVLCPDTNEEIPVNIVDWAASLSYFKQRFGLEA